MELKFTKDIADDKYQITIATDAFSSTDNDLMTGFGEPVIEMGGQIIQGVAQQDQLNLTGITDGVATVSIQRDDRQEYDFSVAFNTDATTTAIDLSNAINLAEAGVVATTPVTPLFNVTSTFKGKAISYSGINQIVITNAIPNVVNILGPLQSDLQLVKSGLVEFFKEFDTADYGTNTETVSLSYIDTIQGRVVDGMEELRQNTNTFTGETIITI